MAQRTSLDTREAYSVALTEGELCDLDDGFAVKARCGDTWVLITPNLTDHFEADETTAVVSEDSISRLDRGRTLTFENVLAEGVVLHIQMVDHVERAERISDRTFES